MKFSELTKEVKEELEKPYILCLDDDPDFNKILKHVLKKHQYFSIATETVEEFVKFLKNYPPKLCFIDINLDMGFGAGYALLQAIRNKMGLSLPIIILSRRRSLDDIAKALELGANDFISKPLDDEYLIRKVNQYLMKDDLPPLPIYMVSDKDKECHYTFNVQIAELSEFGITLVSEHFISKGTSIQLTGEVIQELTQSPKPIKVLITESFIAEEDHLYHCFCEFDYENEDLMNNVRTYILENSPES